MQNLKVNKNQTDMIKSSRKKRRKIFKIAKIYKKDSKRHKKVLQKISENNYSDSENQNDFLNNEIENETINSKLNPNSLIAISKDVYEYLKENKNSKGSHVTDFILTQLKQKQADLSFKNIQRRVYDAINVMNAIGIITKEKNNLKFIEKKSYSGLELNISYMPCSTRSTSLNTVTSRNLKQQIKHHASEINKKQHELLALCSKVRIILKFSFIYLIN